MKKIIIVSIVLYVLLTIIWICIRNPQEPILVEKATIVQLLPKEQNYQFIEDINKRNQNLKNLVCEDLKIDIYWNVHAKARGSLYYEKLKNFRMTAKSLTAKELDIGSNTELFWFWGKRAENGVLHYAKHEDTYRTRLRAPLHPLWIMESFGLQEIDAEEAVVSECLIDNIPFYMLAEHRLSTAGNIVKKITVIRQSNLAVVGHYIYADENLIASTEVEEFVEIDGILVPKLIKIEWHEEDIKMYWQFRDLKINQNIPVEVWNLPEMKKKKDMGS